MRWKTALLALCAVSLLPGPARAADTPAEQLAAASALFDAGKYAEAAARLDAFLEKNAKHPKAGAAWLTLARCRAEQGQHDKAVPAYEKAVAAKDASVLTLAQLGLGESAMATKQYDKAAPALTEALKGNLQHAQAAAALFWLGQARFETKQYPGAEEAFLRAAKDYPQAASAGDATFGAGLAALRQKKHDAARTQFRAVVDRFPKDENRPQAQLMLAQLDAQDKKWGDARAGYERLLTDRSFAVAGGGLRQDAQDGLIQALLELKDYGRAGDLLQQAAQKLKPEDPERARAFLTLGHARTRQKNFPDAQRAYFEAANSKEESVAAEGLYWAANSLLAQNMPAEAALQFRRLAAQYPKNRLAAKSIYRAGEAFETAKQNDKALAAYQEVAEKFPQAPEAAEARKAVAGLSDGIADPAKLLAALKDAPPEQQARGTLRAARLYLQAKQYPQAMATLDALKKTNPPAPLAAEGQYLTGLAHDLQDKPEPAALALALAAKSAPADAPWLTDAHARLAYLYVDLKKPAEAEAAARLALDRKPEPALARQTRLNLMQSLLDQKKWDPALEVGTALLADAPDEAVKATVLYTQAWVTGRKEKPGDALPLWERLLAEHPKSKYAPEALLAVGDARLDAGKYEEARAKYAQAVADFPQSSILPEARFKLGSALYNLDRFAEAATEFDAAAKGKNAEGLLPESLYWSGLAHEKAGKKPEAVQRLSRLVTEFPKNEKAPKAKVRLAALKAVTGG